MYIISLIKMLMYTMLGYFLLDVASNNTKRLCYEELM
jgi:hypothetical protein